MSDEESGPWTVHFGPQTKKNKRWKMYEKLQGDGQGFPLKVPGRNSKLNVRWSKERMGDVLRDCRSDPLSDGSHCLYHGTDQDSALSILRIGIKLKKGSSCKDFSHSDGFYVNYDYEQAKNWAHEYLVTVSDSKVPGTIVRSSKVPVKKVPGTIVRSSKFPVKNVPGTIVRSSKVPVKKVMVKREHPAVIVFKIKDITGECLKLHDINQKPDWQELVKYNRSGRDSKYGLSERLKSEFKDSACVEGPMCEANSIPAADAFQHWKPSGYESLNKQLCVRNKDLAKKFTSEFMDSILLFGEMSSDMNKYLGQVSDKLL